MKTLEQIKKEVAKENGFDDWFELSQSIFSKDGIQRALAAESKVINKVANRYAQQFQSPTGTTIIKAMHKRTAELENELQHVVNALKTVSSFGATTPIIEHAESLINKGK